MIELWIGAFVRPSLRLLKSDPRINSMIRRAMHQLGIGKEAEEDLHKLALMRCEEIRSELIQNMHCILTCVVFGIAFPLLLIIVPMFCCCQMHVLRWEGRKHQESTHTSHAVHYGDATPNAQDLDTAGFGQILASNLLVRQPIRLFYAYAAFGILFVAFCIMIDLEFSIGPMVTLIVVGAFVVSVTMCQMKVGQPLDIQSSSLCSETGQQNVVWFNPSGQIIGQRYVDTVNFRN